MTGIPMRKEDLVSVHGKNGEPKKRQVKGGIVFRQEPNGQGEVQRVPWSTTRVVSFDDELHDHYWHERSSVGTSKKVA